MLYMKHNQGSYILPPTLYRHCPPSWKMSRTICFTINIGLTYKFEGEI